MKNKEEKYMLRSEKKIEYNNELINEAYNTFQLNAFKPFAFCSSSLKAKLF